MHNWILSIKMLKIQTFYNYNIWNAWLYFSLSGLSKWQSSEQTCKQLKSTICRRIIHFVYFWTTFRNFMQVFVKCDFQKKKKNRVRTLAQGSLLKVLELFITVYIQVMLDRNLIIIKICNRAGIKLSGTQWYFQEI